MKEFGIIAVAISLMLGTVRLGVEWTCDSYGEVSGLPTDTIGIGTCMIKDPALGWVSYDERKASRIGEKVDI